MQNSLSRILVVDDVRESALITKSLLARGGFEEIDIATGGVEALTLCGITEAGEKPVSEPLPYQLVVLDIVMPDIDGLEVCARMRLAQRTRYLPILILSSTNETELLNQAYMAGADDFLTKPIDEIRLLARTRTLLRMRREQQRRSLREEELRLQNSTLEQGGIGFSIMDPCTGFLKERMFELLISDCRSEAKSAALGLVSIIDFALYVELNGAEQGQRLVELIAGILKPIAAPIGVIVTRYGSGSFMIAHPGVTSTADIDKWCAKAVAAIADAEIKHGNSIQSEHVSIWTQTEWSDSEGLASIADEIAEKTKNKLLERQ